MVAKTRLGIQVCRPGSHISIWSGCNAVNPPMKGEGLAVIAGLHQTFLAFLRMDCRVEGIFAVGAVGGEARWEVTASLTMEATCAWMSLVVLSSSFFRTNLFSSLATTDANWHLDDYFSPLFGHHCPHLSSSKGSASSIPSVHPFVHLIKCRTRLAYGTGGAHLSSRYLPSSASWWN